MVAGFRRARGDLLYAADALLAFQGISEPTEMQRIGALIEAQFKIRVIRFLKG